MTFAEFAAFADKHPDGALGLGIFVILVLLILSSTIVGTVKALRGGRR